MNQFKKQININTNNTLKLKMKICEAVLSGDVVVVSRPAKYLSGIAGGISIEHRIKSIDTLTSSIKKVCNISAFKIYPNPVSKGNNIHLEINQAGEYEWQLLDNESGLIYNGDLNIMSAKSTSSITIPSNISNGIYYLSLLNQKTKKRNVEKIIIQ